MQGQMYPEEREAIYRCVLTHEPQITVECGTWFGGGSTLAAAKAHFHNGTGWLYTWETEADRYESALCAYETEYPHLLDFVDFNLGDFLGGLQRFSHVDIAILDGPEDAEYDRRCFEEVAKRGARFVICHDFKTEKCRLVQDWPGYEKELVLDTFTGLVIFRKRKYEMEPPDG